MKIAVVGTGYVGLVTGTCLAEAGHSVVCVDSDADKVARMLAGKIPMYEPGLEGLFGRARGQGRPHITTDLAEGVTEAEVVFLALPTPPGEDGAADLSAVLQVAGELGPLLREGAVVVDKSTVPVGTADKVRAAAAARSAHSFDVVSNPEFLREGLAVQDFMHPDRIVIGSSDEKSREVMRRVYASFIDRPEQFVCMDAASAEMTKYAANTFLAMKVSFINEIANLCDLVGADVGDVRRGIGPDPRIGQLFLQAGIGYGGSCFPKDVEALRHMADEHGYNFQLLKSIIEVNAAQKQLLVRKLSDYYAGNLSGKRVALWGLAFKPDTDDIREAPALEIIESLLESGAAVVAYDPEAVANVKRYFGDKPGLEFSDSPLAAATHTDALLIATEWDEFRNPDFDALHAAMKQPVIFDGRNMYDPALVAGAGFEYFSIGRPAKS